MSKQDEIDQLHRELKEAREWIANVIRCYDRDNVHDRKTLRGCLVSITHTAAAQGRDILRPRDERANP